MGGVRQYFSDFFGIDEDIVEAYGAVNISLINDMPLFIDPFLLFNSEKDEYQAIHNEVIKYLLFLREKAEQYPAPPNGMIPAWYQFAEVKQTWLGFSLDGNAGRGLGKDFAQNLHFGLQTIFKGFGTETITKSAHLEKLCLISPLVGRDKISDFTTNFAKQYLLKYTADFAAEYLADSQCSVFCIPRVAFNYATMVWEARSYRLPTHANDYILLTPRDLLTRDNTFINRPDMIDSLQDIAPAVQDEVLRFQLNCYFVDVLGKKKKEMSTTEKDRAAAQLIAEHPELIDYYIKHKEDIQEQATSVSQQVVQEVRQLFNVQLQELTKLLQDNTGFYDSDANTYNEAFNRVMFLKKVIEDMDGYRLFYINGKPLRRESDLQIMYRLIWYASEMDVNREVNNGRGPVDFKVSKGSKDTTLVEFKLASNSKLKQNLAKQVEIYQNANCTNKAIKVILFFTEDERTKLLTILNDLGLHGCKDIVLIDGTSEKPSASNVKM